MAVLWVLSTIVTTFVLLGVYSLSGSDYWIHGSTLQCQRVSLGDHAVAAKSPATRRRGPRLRGSHAVAELSTTRRAHTGPALRHATADHPDALQQRHRTDASTGPGSFLQRHRTEALTGPGNCDTPARRHSDGEGEERSGFGDREHFASVSGRIPFRRSPSPTGAMISGRQRGPDWWPVRPAGGTQILSPGSCKDACSLMSHASHRWMFAAAERDLWRA